MFFKVHRTAERKCDAAWERNSFTFTHTICAAEAKTSAAAASVPALLELRVRAVQYQLK